MYSKLQWTVSRRKPTSKYKNSAKYHMIGEAGMKRMIKSTTQIIKFTLKIFQIHDRQSDDQLSDTHQPPS